jgi:hypothetical protein
LLIRPFALNDSDAAYAVLEGHADVWKFDPGYQRTHEQRAILIACRAMIRFAFDEIRLAELLRSLRLRTRTRSSCLKR